MLSAVGLGPTEDEKEKEKKRLEKAIQRNLRERKARRVAADRDAIVKTLEKISAKAAAACT